MNRGVFLNANLMVEATRTLNRKKIAYDNSVTMLTAVF